MSSKKRARSSPLSSLPPKCSLNKRTRASPSPSKFSLKLLIDTKSERVLFAEASKEFIDFLFNLFRLPIGTMTGLLIKDGTMVGCLGKLYESIENMSDEYMNNPKQDKNILLKPSDAKLYMCGKRCSNAVTYAINTACSNCGFNMKSTAVFMDKNKTKETIISCGGERDLVKGGVKYIVMDDLEVRPMSTISTMAMISKFNVKHTTCLQEKVVELKMEEGIKLLKASLQCKNALTSVFLKDIVADVKKEKY